MKIKIINRHPWWRRLEFIPGSLAWAAIILPVVLAAFAPVWTASFMIVYTITWFFRSIKLSINLYRSTVKVKKAINTNWEKLIGFNDHPEKIDYEIKKLLRQEHARNSEKNPEIIKKLQALQRKIEFIKSKNQYKKSKEIVHAIIYVTCKESFELIRESIKSYVASNYPASKIIMVFAGEQTDAKNFLITAKKIQAEFRNRFFKFITTLHPANIPGEIRGKSANATYAAKNLKKELDKLKIDYENVMVSVFDADTVVHSQYFNELTFTYLTNDQRFEKAYQPTHMFHNNIWDVPMMIRMVALSCTFWRMAESMEPGKYKSFSSRSLSFKTIMDVNYWDPSIIPEDSRQYWTAYTIYNGRHEVIPIYSPVYLDAVLSDTYMGTFKSQYKQLRRWAWGVCDFPFVVLNLRQNPNIKLLTKVRLVLEFLKNHLLWSTGPIILTFMGFLPGLLNTSFRNTVLAYNLPGMMSNILTLASSGIVMCTIISLVLIPRNSKRNLLQTVSLCLQWLLIPVVSIFLSAIPALDAQTRLILGKYLEYGVTEKARKNVSVRVKFEHAKP